METIAARTDLKTRMGMPPKEIFLARKLAWVKTAAGCFGNQLMNVTRWGSAEPQRDFFCALIGSVFVFASSSDVLCRGALFTATACGTITHNGAHLALLWILVQAFSMAMQSIAGVSPPEVTETTVMTVWPSVAATSLGRTLGRVFRIRDGFGPVSLGRLALLACLPIGLMLYLSMRLPWAIQRYRLTNRRVIVERGIGGKIQQYCDLDQFDSIELVQDPGQEWYAAGDLVFRKGAVEKFRLPGVSRPEPFRQTCLKVQQSYRSVAAIQAHAAGAA